MRLFTKAHIPVFCGKHHGHPVVSCVTRNFFIIASATYNVHNFFTFLLRLCWADLLGLPHATEKTNAKNKKKSSGFSSAGPTQLCVSDRAVFPAYSNKKWIKN
jgi:hypothetical protein